MPPADTPESATPDRGLLSLLQTLAHLPGCDAHIVSGRSKADLQDWFGEVRIALWGEHGFWHRPAGSHRWQAAQPVALGWKAEVVAMLERACAIVPGARIEKKAVSVAWHYRLADARVHARAISHVAASLRAAIPAWNLELIRGRKVIEVRPAGVSKAVVAATLGLPDGRLVLAFGDDRTDEELFSALPVGSITVSVGRPLAHARYYLAGPRAVRAALSTIVSQWRCG